MPDMKREGEIQGRRNVAWGMCQNAKRTIREIDKMMKSEGDEGEGRR